MATGVHSSNTRIYATSYPAVPLADEATTASGDAKTFTITNQVKRVLDPNTPVVVEISTDSGTTWTTATNYTLHLVGAVVIFPTAQAGAEVRLHSGSYLPYLAIAGANTAEFAGQLNTQETTDFADGGYKSYTPLTLEGTLKAHCWWHNSAIIRKLTSRELVAISFLDDAGERHEGFCWVSDSDLKTATKGVVEVDFTFQLTDQFFVN